MSNTTTKAWTVAYLLRPNFEAASDAGLFEIEEAHEQIVDLLEQGRHAEAHAIGESYRCLIAAAPDLLSACEGVSAGMAMLLAAIRSDRFGDASSLAAALQSRVDESILAARGASPESEGWK